MSNKTSQRDLQITFIHQFKRATRSEWPDKFRVCWYFNPETLDYIYEQLHRHPSLESYQKLFCLEGGNTPQQALKYFSFE